MAFVDRAGVRIYWRSDGHPGAPPLLLSNSLGTDCAFWDPVMPRLADYFHVIRMDTRGHGASDAPPGPYSMQMLAEDTLAVADAAGLRQFAFAGVSMGGGIGMHLAINHPERLARLKEAIAVLAEVEEVARMAKAQLGKLERRLGAVPKATGAQTTGG